MTTVNVISLGAGVQSTTMLLMACHGEITPKPKWAVFADTGWEPRKVYKHLQWLTQEASKHGIEVVVTGKGNIRDDHLRAARDKSRVDAIPFFVKVDGQQEEGVVPRQCTKGYKIEMIQKKVRELLGYLPRQRIPENSVIQWVGISVDEIERAKTSGQKWVKFRHPLLEIGMNRLDCMNWLIRKGYYVPPKSSCIGCPYHNNHTWAEMKRNEPEEFQDAVEFEREMRRLGGLRKMEGKVYLHRSCIPLDQIDFESQMDLFYDGFINECEGMCGV